MSSTLSTYVPVFNGANLYSWAPKMLAYMRSQGAAYVIKKPRSLYETAEAGTTATSAALSGATGSGRSQGGGSTTTSTSAATAASHSLAEWDKDDEKAMGMIRLCVSDAIGQMLDTKTSASEMWNALDSQYGRKGLGGAINEFSDALRIKIPGNQEPSSYIDTITMHFAASPLSRLSYLST